MTTTTDDNKKKKMDSEKVEQTVDLEQNTEETPLQKEVLELAFLIEKGNYNKLAEGLSCDDSNAKCNIIITSSNVKGPLLHHAVFNGRKKMTNLIYDKTSDAQLQIEALFLSIKYCKYDIGLLLLSKNGNNVNYQREVDGNAILHCCCTRPKPPVSFISDICRLKILRVNTTNYAGLTPIHLLALHSVGVEGRDSCQLLKAKGALLDKQTPGRKTALQLTKNSFLREILSLNSSGRRRQNPLQLISREEQSELDLLPFDKLPKLKESEIGPLGRTFPSEEGRDVNKKKKIQPEEEGELVNRLYTIARQKQEENMKQLTDRVLCDKRDKKIKPTVDEQCDSVNRLHSVSKDQSNRLQQLVGKYLSSPIEPRCISPEDLTESITRLYTTSIQKSREKQTSLMNKYLPATLISNRCGGKRLTAAENGAVSQRLHDAAVTRQKETLSRLKHQYLIDNKSSKVMTDGEWKEMGERLSSKK